MTQETNKSASTEHENKQVTDTQAESKSEGSTAPGDAVSENTDTPEENGQAANPEAAVSSNDIPAEMPEAERAEEAVENTAEEVAAEAEESVEEVINEAETVAAQVEETIEEVAAEVKSEVEAVATEVEESIEETVAEVKAEAETVATEAVETIEEAVAEVKEEVTASEAETKPEETKEVVEAPAEKVEEVAVEAEKEVSAEVPVAETEVKAEAVEQPVAVEAKAEETPEANANGEVTAGAGSKSDKKEEGLESEHDLKEKDDDHDHDEEDEEVDYSHLSKSELVDVIKELSHSDAVLKAEGKARLVKNFFDEIRRKEREEAMKKFVADGGEESDFSYRPDELTQRFDANYQLIRDRKYHFQKDREKLKETNLVRKQEILEKLREFVDSDETNISFENFKKFQEEWKNIGPVPGAHARTLWANYNALIDRFYDNRSIYFELKELDRRKNLKSKYELCERAEKLTEMTQINEAVKELNDLHHEFKHLGPVPKEEQEALWLRFKAASDAIYERRKVFVDKLKGELDENLAKKKELAEDAQKFVAFDSDRIKAWNEQTKGILELQKRWEAIGGLPRAHAKEINKRFWSAFKTFFSNKNQFFKKLDAERESNLELKRKMVEQAKELAENTDFQATADKLKKLQRDWREIGPVPGKFRESIYQEFKSACDAFFNAKRANQDAASDEYVANLEKKKEICGKIEKLTKGGDDALEQFRELQEEFANAGFVPKRAIGEIKALHNKAVEKFISSLDTLDDDEKERLKIENEVNDILSGPNANQKLYRKEQSLRKQISAIENDISVWKNNMEFFNDSKTANKLKDEFMAKIEKASDELQQLKKQLRIIRTAS